MSGDSGVSSRLAAVRHRQPAFRRRRERSADDGAPGPRLLDPACTSARVEPSHVLRAMGLDDDAAHGALRFSFGRFTTAGEVDYAARRIREAVAELRALCPDDWHAACFTSDAPAARGSSAGWPPERTELRSPGGSA